MRRVFDVPDRGDIVMISVPAGKSRRPGPTGRRAAVVLSPQSYNARVGLALICPISSFVTGYPFEVAVPVGLPVAGVVLADQVQSLDWRACRAERVGSLPSAALEEVL